MLGLRQASLPYNQFKYLLNKVGRSVFLPRHDGAKKHYIHLFIFGNCSERHRILTACHSQIVASALSSYYFFRTSLQVLRAASGSRLIVSSCSASTHSVSYTHLTL